MRGEQESSNKKKKMQILANAKEVKKNKKIITNA
jgi:hypothetical protein